MKAIDSSMKKPINKEPYFQILFPFGKLRTWFDLTIVDGPSENGLYILRLEDKINLGPILIKLEAADQVKFAQSRFE